MAKGQKKKERRVRKEAGLLDFSKFPLGKRNFIFLGIGVLLLVVGYLFMMQGPADSVSSRTIAPVILVISYCVIIPYAILHKEKSH